MNIKLKAVGYAVLFCLGMVGTSLGITALVPYMKPWMAVAVAFGFLFYLLYSMFLSGLEFDQSINNMRKDLNITEEK